MKKLIILLTGLFLLVSCSKDDILVQMEQQVKTTDTIKVVPPVTPPTPKTYTLYKESYLNQRSGIVWYWHDNKNPEFPYITIVDSWLNTPGGVNQWYGGGHIYGDVNKDGYQDIMVTYMSSVTKPELIWLINEGDNLHFKKSTQYFNGSTIGIKSHKILKTDVNNDGIADYIALGVDEAIQNAYTGNFTVLIGKQNGTFDINKIPNPNNYWFHNGAAGDLNGDGNVDVITASFIWWGDGKGNFEKTFNSHPTDMSGYYGWTTSPLVYEILDMDKDGWNDLILKGPTQNTTIVLNNKGTFNSSNQKIILPDVKYKAVQDFEITDFDKDGDLDILELSQLGGNPATETFDAKYSVSYITIYFNNNMTFTPDETTLSESLDGNYMHGTFDKYGWSLFKLDDIDGDGVDEIVSENYQEGTYNALKKVNGIWKKVTITFGK
jgi:hypothetical protein